MASTSFKVIPPGSPWPSGDCRDIALINVSEPEVEAAAGAPLFHGIEDGMGPWAAIAGTLPCGAVIELIRYAQGPISGFVLRSDIGFDTEAVIGETLSALKASPAAVAWRAKPEGGA